MNRHKRTTFAG